MSIISNYDLNTLQQYINESNSMKELQCKLGYSKNGNSSSTIRRYCEQHNISLEHLNQMHKTPVKRNEENVFIKNSTASQATLRRWYLKGNYTEYKCAICGQEPFWNGKELTLTLDHINGENTDNELQNLRWVCPNCDRQLETFCSKNIKTKNTSKINYCEICGEIITLGAKKCPKCYGLSQRIVDRPSKEELFNILSQNKGNFTQTGKIFNVSDNTIRKWCKAYNLPYHSNDYNQKGI